MHISLYTNRSAPKELPQILISQILMSCNLTSHKWLLFLVLIAARLVDFVFRDCSVMP